MRHFLICAVLLYAACNDPCSRESKAAFVGIGGPIGILVAALEQCDAATPPALIAAPVAAPEPVAAEPDDMAQPSPDMAELPDLYTPPDLTQPPDLRRLPETVNLQLGSWSVSGPVTAASPSTWHCAAGFDFAAGKSVPCEFTIPLKLPLDAATARSITLSYTVTAALSWGPTSSICAAQGQPNAYLVKAGTSSVCLRGSVGAGLVIDGAATAPLINTTPSQLSAQPPPGTSYPVSATSKVSLRLQLLGDVDVAALSGTVTATLQF